MVAKIADPTLASLELFNDSTLWDIVRNVPVFRPHIRKDADGEELFRVTLDDLPEIARVCNEKAENVAVLPRLQIGHTRLNLPETQQAPVVGYAREFRVGKFGPKKKPAILCDFYYRKDKASEAKKHPFRSSEYYPDTKEISAIALLTRDPALDLGMLVYSQGRTVYFYSSKDVTMAGETVDDDLETQVNPDGGNGINPEELERFKAYMKSCYPHFDKMHEAYAAVGPGTPGGSNVVVPGQAGGKKPHDYQRNGTKKPVVTGASALVKENAELYERVALLELERKADRQAIQYEKKLREIDPEGQSFVLEDELTDLRSMTEDQATKHLARLERAASYSRQPIGQDLVHVDDSTATARDSKPPTQYEREAACNLVTALQEEGKDITFGDALKQVRKQK